MRYFYSLLQKVDEFKLRNRQPKGNILMFHQVDNNKDNWVDDKVSLTEDSFLFMINSLIKMGIKFKQLNQLSESNSEKNFFITFDDGYMDTYQNAYPILKKYNIPFCIFIAKNFIGKDKYITQQILKELSNEPLCTFGSHTLNHPKLRYLSNEDARKEINSSKEYIKDILQREVKYFAFPYGSIYACSKRDIKFVRNMYDMSFSTLNSSFSSKCILNKHFIPRINVNENNYSSIGEKYES